MNEAFWQGKRVFLTGQSGFKGGWLSLWLTRMGARVSGFALAAPTQPSLFAVAGIEKEIDHRQGDVRDFESLRAAFRNARPEMAFHLAAQPLVRKSYLQPLDTFETNVLGTSNFLQAAREISSLRAMVVVTSDKCYRVSGAGPAFIESDPLGGADPYSASKACAEIVSEAYRSSYFSSADSPGLASARAGNVIGGGDWAEDRLVPDVLKALEKNGFPEIRNPASIRPWQHVLEPLSGYLLLAEKLWLDPQGSSEAWNFGPRQEDEKSVEWIVTRLAALWGSKEKWKPQEGRHPAETKVLKLDASKARARLGWMPRWNLDTALEAVVSWHRHYLDGDDMKKFSLSQIQKYEGA